VIYFLLAESVRRVKIGYTNEPDVEDRIAAIRTASPVELTLLGTRS
jgi:hypothetical protein